MDEVQSENTADRLVTSLCTSPLHTSLLESMSVCTCSTKMPSFMPHFPENVPSIGQSRRTRFSFSINQYGWYVVISAQA